MENLFVASEPSFQLGDFPDFLLEIARELKHEGATEVLLVGGTVRNLFLGYLDHQTSHDYDVEVYGLSVDAICSFLEKTEREFDACGKSFGVIKLKGLPVDLSVPRKENRIGIKHTDFQVEICDMPVEEALKRRDFTVNAMAVSLLDGTFFDPFNGRADARDRILRHVSEAFSEDPVRVLRGAWMASRFALRFSKELLAICRTMDLSSLSNEKERVWKEWQKLAKTKWPSIGIQFLHACGHLPSQIFDLVGVQQDPEWHPEGDVYIHTLHVINAMKKLESSRQLMKDLEDDLFSDETLDPVVMFFAALCHDFGKPSTTAKVDGRWRAHGHCEAGVPITQDFLRSIGAPESLISVVSSLVAEHLAHVNFTDGNTDRTVRRLAERLKPANIIQLRELVHADLMGRPFVCDLQGKLDNPLDNIVERAIQMEVALDSPKNIILGRHVIANLGIPPGPRIGEIVKEAFRQQLDGTFTTLEQGVEWLANTYSNPKET